MIMGAILSKYCGKQEMQQCIISQCVCGVVQIREIRNHFHDVSDAMLVYFVCGVFS